MCGICYFNYLFLMFLNSSKIAPIVKKAASEGHKDVVLILASNGADINHKNNNGWTALMWGICYNIYLF